jgi:hypothetical protein
MVGHIVQTGKAGMQDSLALQVVADTTQDDGTRLAAAMALRKSAHEHRDSVDAAVVLEAYLACESFAVARQLEMVVQTTTPPLERRNSWESCVAQLQAAWTLQANAGPIAFGKALRGCRGFLRLIVASLELISEVASESSDEQFDDIRGICDICMSCMSSVIARAHQDGAAQLLDLTAVVCKIYVRVFASLWDYDPSFESNNLLPGCMVADFTWCELFRSIISSSDSNGAPGVGIDSPRACAQKWALRAMCYWAMIHRKLNSIGDDAQRLLKPFANCFFRVAWPMRPSFLSVFRALW